jgi:hypothetical protein
MNKRTLLLAGFIVVAALTRLLPHPDNFAPITGMAVFGGIRFGSRRNAVIAPLLALFFSDLGLEVLHLIGRSQQWGIYGGMWVQYVTIAVIVLMARLAQGTRSPITIAATTLVGSCLFFVVTNFAVWVGGGMYPHTLEGLELCYTKAIPFFRNGVKGDVTYATILFGAWALAEIRFPALAPAPAKQ